MKNNLSSYNNILKELGISDNVTTTFNNYSLMLDLSRGRIFKLSYLKEFIKKASYFGVNEIWLYLEDLVKIDEPFYGYQRGGYTLSELKEIDDFALSCGIEMVFSIQTLGHMEQFLRWPLAWDYRDSQDVLLCNFEKTYTLIEKVLRFCKDAFASSKIHLGMDETFTLGKGAYIKHFGYKEPKDIYQAHLLKVKEIAKKIGYQDIMIWSDMIISMINKDSYYVISEDIKIDNNYINNLKDIDLVYWDYYNDDLNKIKKVIEVHKKLSGKITYASGFWIWQRLVVDKTQTLKTIDASIKVCRQNKINDICFTLWNDNGGYCNPFEIYKMLPYSTSKIFNLDEEKTKFIYEKVLNKNFLKEDRKTIINELGLDSISILYDDVLFGIYLNNYYYFKKDILKKALKKLDCFLINDYKADREFYSLFKIIKEKIKTRLFLLDNINNKRVLLKLIPSLNKMIKYYTLYLKEFEKTWNKTSKENGLEVHHLRLAGHIKRISHLISLIKKGENLEDIIEKPACFQELDTRFSQIFPTILFIRQ